MRRLVVLAMAAACSTVPDKTTSPDNGEDPSDETEPHPQPRHDGGGPQIESEIGALDPKAMNEAFRSTRKAIMRCFEGANDGMALKVIGGRVDVEVRIKSDGSVRYVFVPRSTLGHHGAERCIMNVLSEKSWPKPKGGEGIASTNFKIEAPAARQPFEWSADDIGSARAKLEAALQSCRSQAGTSSLTVTVYVDPDGKPLAAGGASGDENGLSAVDCAVDAALALTYPSPGSYPAKVTVTVR